jgi:hypothetical protein
VCVWCVQDDSVRSQEVSPKSRYPLPSFAENILGGGGVWRKEQITGQEYNLIYLLVLLDNNF